MATTGQVPTGLGGLGSRTSSMSYADVYGAADDTGPSSAVAGSVGYVAATQAEPGIQNAPTIAVADAEGGLARIIEFGHSLLDTPQGIAFVIGGGVLLLAWHELA